MSAQLKEKTSPPLRVITDPSSYVVDPVRVFAEVLKQAIDDLGSEDRAVFRRAVSMFERRTASVEDLCSLSGASMIRVYELAVETLAARTNPHHSKIIERRLEALRAAAPAPRLYLVPPPADPAPVEEVKPDICGRCSKASRFPGQYKKGLCLYCEMNP